jgi:hypothetical protein
MAAAVWDIRGWLFFWFFVGLAFAFSFALSSAPKSGPESVVCLAASGSRYQIFRWPRPRAVSR